MRIRLTKDQKYKFGITLRKGEIRNARAEAGTVQVEVYSGVWCVLPKNSYVKVNEYRIPVSWSTKNSYVKVNEYCIPVSWSVCATMTIEAESLEDALEAAQNAPLPTDSDYLEGSFKVDEELLDVV